MIYAICAIQLLNVVAALVIVRWCLAYIADRDQLQKHQAREHAETLEFLSRQNRDMLQELLDRSLKERELLIERIQHPEQTIAQAAGVTGETGVGVVEEEDEAREEGLIEEVEEGEEFHIPAQPISPIQAIGGE